MRSRANIKSHPIHPMLVVFPIAFYTGTLVFDILGLITHANRFFVTAYYTEIAGIAGAVAAAIPGFIDYLNTVPPDSSAKTRATRHGLLNTGSLLIFLGAWLYRRNPDASLYTVTIVEFIGFLFTLFAGWLGGTLVYRNQIGVDPRYAGAGKWKEAYLGKQRGSVEAATADELGVDQMKLLHAGDRRIVLARTEKGYAAFEDHCSHKGGSLAGGSMICGTVQCPWHGSHFDVNTGEVKSGPAKAKIKTYQVEEKEGKVFITL
jgi:uncharacterized membrane protein/nitrite reductase/ring-hydroxylating ferredoxin subunit